MLDSAAFVGKYGKAALAAAALVLVACGGETAGGSGEGGSAGPGGAGGQGGGGPGGGGQGGQGGGIVDPDLVPIFVAQGMVGRTVVSCDDGMTWVGNRSDDDTYPCFSSIEFDCDHRPGAGRGITYGNGFFVATFGWGEPGSIRRSKNGVDWETVLEGKTFAGIVYGSDVFLAGERPPQVADAFGGAWAPGGDVDSEVWNVRRTGFAPHDGGRFLLAFNSGNGNDINVSKDKGATWARPTTLPAACAGDIQWAGGFAYGNGTIVALGGTGVACRSLDGGDTWTASNIGGEVDARLLWTGDTFVTWGRDADYVSQRYTSPDGATWTKTPTEVRKKNADGTTQTSPGPLVGAVTRSDGGTYVAVNGNWGQWYDQQRFFRSTDGVTWDELPAGAFPGSHPIQFITHGLGERSVVCP
ncbi:hypothetical protein [Polyangium sorediatum]|uniref:Exo-alpha-sialidase n=1 Tax=Polyangium sorediatum TaxID=889274 RepID=A0ABT6P5L6_9BACT|nr:hypothetical protein [Polyangium sorediatum]MDI1435907.1 hypothetical protein [Polyangium sorediatum]